MSIWNIKYPSSTVKSSEGHCHYCKQWLTQSEVHFYINTCTNCKYNERIHREKLEKK